MSSDSSISRPVGGADDAVGRDLVAGAQLDEVVEHDLLDRDLAGRRRRARRAPAARVEHREPVERALGPDLLHDPDQRVGDEHDAEQSRPGSRPTTRIDDEHRAEDGVEPREDVGRGRSRRRCGWCARSPSFVEPARDALADLVRRSARSRASRRARRRRRRIRWSRRAVTDGCVSDCGRRRDELDLAGVVVLDEAVAAQLGEQRLALVGAARDQLVAGLRAARARAAGRGSGRRAGSRAGRSRSRARAAPPRASAPSSAEPGADRDSHDHLVGVAERHARGPGASPRPPRRATPSAARRRRSPRPPRRGAAGRGAATGRPRRPRARSTQTSSRSRISSSRSSSWLTSAARLWSLNSSAEYARPTATSEMFFISTSTSTARSRSVIAGSSSTVGGRHSGAPASSRSSAMPAGRAAQDQHVVGQEHVVAVGVDEPLLAAADRDDAHADLHRQLDVGERAAARAPSRRGRARGARPPRPPRGRRRASAGCRAGG